VESVIVAQRLANPEYRRQSSDIDTIMNQHVKIDHDNYEQIKIKIPESTMNYLSAQSRVTNEMMLTIK
jgi:hypothetical protein